MINPTEADIGRRVVYRRYPHYCKTEEGVITSFNDHYVFVSYGGQCTSQATARENLEYISGTDSPAE